MLELPNRYGYLNLIRHFHKVGLIALLFCVKNRTVQSNTKHSKDKNSIPCFGSIKSPATHSHTDTIAKVFICPDNIRCRAAVKNRLNIVPSTIKMLPKMIFSFFFMAPFLPAAFHCPYVLPDWLFENHTDPVLLPRLPAL